MATSVNEILENPSVLENSSVLDDGVLRDNCAPEVLPNHGMQQDPPTTFSEEEVRAALEKSASTGEFWLDWRKLKSILSYHLKQVLSQYPEASMTSEQQITSLGETFLELVERLDHALHSFDEGPPFTLQRLCEILLAPRSMYPKLSKLSLALEKNLLVTSMLTISTDPNPTATEQNTNGAHVESVVAQPQPELAENGVENPSDDDKDEIMAEVQVAETGENTTMDMETTEDNIKSSGPNPSPTQSVQMES
ncbi:Unknown protein [Striga hermonthica]|uniref:Serine/threonine-protein phosphatase 4 regulatory subunit 2 n=1 Tax=Striga hermonthica TaxID=68872 RepID=A0A9N7MKY9_STRHE|nr:Unknown protein [Striga hermonthica]